MKKAEHEAGVPWKIIVANRIYRLMRLRQKFLYLVLIIHINFTEIHFLWKWWRIISIWDCGFPRREISKKPYIMLAVNLRR